MRRLLVLSVLLSCSLLTAVPALAHKVRVFAYTEGDQVVAESSFPGGNVCKNCRILLRDAGTDEQLLEGVTGEDGIWRFPLPASAAKAAKGLTLHLFAGEGHEAEWTLEPEEYRSAVPAAATAATPAAPAAPVAEPAAAPAAESAAPAVEPAAAEPVPAVPAGVDMDQLRRVVEEAVDVKIAPLKRALLEAEDSGPRLTDILGGIGWLVGLAGLAAWGRSRRRP
ncbi:MAG: hypothetical protein AB7D57_12515 [Desulfovibrionaceae bacterium]